MTIQTVIILAVLFAIAGLGVYYWRKGVDSEDKSGGGEGEERKVTRKSGGGEGEERK